MQTQFEKGRIADQFYKLLYEHSIRICGVLHARSHGIQAGQVHTGRYRAG
jgi:hypothetical protein